MPVRTSSWPTGWPSFTPQDDDLNDTYQQNLKKEIISEYGEAALKQAWVRACKELVSVTSSIAKQGSSAVPIFEFGDVIGPQNWKILAQMKTMRCFIIRGVIPQAKADKLFEELQGFVHKNSGITGWPSASPAVFHLYSSPIQLKLRTHPNQLKIQRLLNGLFTDSNCSPEELEAQCEPILYPDALRIRQPGQEFLGLGPHIDAGGLSRWADHPYRRAYDKIFSGHPEDWDPYDLTHRRDAAPDLFPSGVHCSALRTFQGWTALTPCGPGEGGLMILPDVKTVTAYMMLRPFFKCLQDKDWKDPENWTVDDSAWFPGTKRWDSQMLSPGSHPHLRLEETLVGAPHVEPGDTIWWHGDVSLIKFLLSMFSNRANIIALNLVLMLMLIISLFHPLNPTFIVFKDPTDTKVH
ncbi:duf1479 domain-containing protein [Amniculicola lignicola CBS 123094]|uniref:Duf1479 domain-containing protein n=1 Tax=Amniculicola lignicola CBS 123094 TaxID=1392246 RepID=A0A6A5X173_9PLEO|nr:duf1479 domain-containing protein [Amniculicola lignicola CBS 123094]